MTGGKPPFDPFSPGERTVIKPNPGGRRTGGAEATPPQQQAQRPGTATPPRSDELWGQARQPAGAAPTGGMPQPQQQPRPAPREADVQVPDLQALPGGIRPNPILDEARPLLMLLSNVRIARQVPPITPLMDQVVRGIDSLDAALRAKGIDDHQATVAKYIMCATADDIVQNLPAADRLLWTQYSMLSRYFRTRDSGVGFFEELQKLRANPAVNFDLLALMHACLSLGFEGKYRAAGGDVALQQIRRDLFQTLRTLKQRTVENIGPHWRGQDIPPEHERRMVPPWAVAASALGLLLLSFMVFRWLLAGDAGLASAKLAALHPQSEITLVRASFKPMEPVRVPETTQLERIRQKLADDISANRLSADYAGKDIVIRLLNDSVFDKGSDKVRQTFIDAMGHVAMTLNAEKGAIRVVGHSDDTPLKSTVRFKDNQDLSEKRAKAVALLLLPGLDDAARLVTEGVGDTEPLDPAKTPEARAKNRRVEVFIPRDDL